MPFFITGYSFCCRTCCCRFYCYYCYYCFDCSYSDCFCFGQNSYFYRSFKIANKIINQAFQESNGTVLYLGEWHTHPVDNPIPSPTDKTSIENIYNTANLSVNVIIYLIIGRSSIYYGCYDGKKHYKLV